MVKLYEVFAAFVDGIPDRDITDRLWAVVKDDCMKSESSDYRVCTKPPSLTSRGFTQYPVEVRVSRGGTSKGLVKMRTSGPNKTVKYPVCAKLFVHEGFKGTPAQFKDAMKLAFGDPAADFDLALGKTVTWKTVELDENGAATVV